MKSSAVLTRAFTFDLSCEDGLRVGRLILAELVVTHFRRIHIQQNAPS